MVEYGWDQTPTPDLGLDITKAPADIQKLYKWVIQKTYGEDVASAYAQGLVAAGIIAKNAEAMSLFTSGQMDALDTFVKDTLIELTDKDIISAPEIIQARGGKPTLGARLDETTAQLTNIVDDHSLSPDNFEGSDKEKIEQSIAHVLSQGGGSVRLPRMYDLTGESPIMLDKINSGDRRVVIFLGDGGGFKKEDSGYIFSSTVSDSGDWFFNNVLFHSITGAGTKIFDGVNLIRIQWNNCHARNVDTLVDAPDSYIQTYSFNGGSVIGGKGSAIKVPSAYDLVCGGHFYVEHRENFFEQIKETTNQFKGLYNVKFTDMMVEGLSGYAFKITRAEALKLSGVYFEVNKVGHILMNEADYLDSVNIESCRFHENATTELESAIVWGHYLKGCSTNNNFSRNIALHDTSFIHEASIYKVTSYEDVALNNSRENIPNIDIRGKIIKQEDNYKLTTKDGIYDSSLRGYTSNTDYNSLTKSGVYHMSGSAPNAPIAMWAICEVYDTGSYILQRANTRPDGSIYTRYKEPGGWTAWRRNASESIV